MLAIFNNVALTGFYRTKYADWLILGPILCVNSEVIIICCVRVLILKLLIP